MSKQQDKQQRRREISDIEALTEAGFSVDIKNDREEFPVQIRINQRLDIYCKGKWHDIILKRRGVWNGNLLSFVQNFFRGGNTNAMREPMFLKFKSGTTTIISPSDRFRN